MKKLIMTILILSGTAAHAEPRLFATCKSNNIIVTTYSDGSDFGAYSVKVGEESVTYQGAYETTNGYTRFFSMGSKDYASISPKTGKGSVTIAGTTTELNCTMDPGADPLIHAPIQNCTPLPPWVGFGEETPLCQDQNIWGHSSMTNFLCCKRPPV
ncbi:hypothetical protein [Bdellovibrio sp. HCB288]|uniref:hypothetical protein n=1 Tax=Bdellovibrio sp. HCB288 TaxID=3394355 RepID=UPI0039B3CAD6